MGGKSENKTSSSLVQPAIFTPADRQELSFSSRPVELLNLSRASLGNSSSVVMIKPQCPGGHWDLITTTESRHSGKRLNGSLRETEGVGRFALRGV